MNLFDCAIILSLDKRAQLWSKLYEDCISRGWNTEIFLVGGGGLFANIPYGYADRSGEEAKNGDSWIFGTCHSRYCHWNAFHSHQALIKHAKKKGYNSILLLEDDAYITRRFDLVMQIVQPQLDVIDYDLLYLGWWIGDHENDMHAGSNLVIEQEWNNYKLASIRKVSEIGAGGFHAVVIRESFYDWILALPDKMPVDCHINHRGHQHFKSYYVSPKVCHVHSTYSYCEERIVNRDKI